jgi:predicted dinucleotide-binding enzyme
VIVRDLIDEFGLDVVDAGPLAEGGRFEPGAPCYGATLDADATRAALALA